jgi:hypothetical protein
MCLVGKGVGKSALLFSGVFEFGIGYFSLDVAQEIYPYGIRKFSSVH